MKEIFVLKNNKIIKVKLVNKEIVDEKVKVYNLEVNNNHTFFANGFAVHNKAIPPEPIPWPSPVVR